jgi:hypothetical protein
MKKPLEFYDSFLETVGLARRRRIAEFILPAATLVAFGAAIGAAVGLMLAPSSGRRLRQDMGDRFDQLRNKVSGEARRHGIVNATPQQQQPNT